MQVSTGVAARRLGVSSSMVQRWADDGLLPCTFTDSGFRRFSLSDIGKLRAKLPSTLSTDYVSITEAAQMIGESRRRVERWVRQGQLSSVRTSERGKHLIRMTDLEKAKRLKQERVDRPFVATTCTVKLAVKIVAELINSDEPQNSIATKYNIDQGYVSRIYRQCLKLGLPVQERPQGRRWDWERKTSDDRTTASTDIDAQAGGRERLLLQASDL